MDLDTIETRLTSLEEEVKRLKDNYRLVLEMWGKTIKEKKELKAKIQKFQEVTLNTQESSHKHFPASPKP